jgi:hypothetical protein
MIGIEPPLASNDILPVANVVDDKLFGRSSNLFTRSHPCNLQLSLLGVTFFFLLESSLITCDEAVEALECLKSWLGITEWLQDEGDSM